MPAVSRFQDAVDPTRSPSGARAGSGAILNVAGYRFVALDDLEALRTRLVDALNEAGVVGTVLLASEGINVSLAGSDAAVRTACEALRADARLAPLKLRRTRSDAPPFGRLKVRVRPEIIAFDGAGRADAPRAPAVAPEELARWLDGGRPEVRLLDTRNAYEVDAGAFEGALALEIDHFRDFREAVDAALADGTLDTSTPLVTYCTGGVRCEKAAPWLLERGFDEVWQLDGGILGWLEERGAQRWRGDCFVFDDRVSVDTALRPSGATLCPRCNAAVRDAPCGCVSA